MPDDGQIVGKHFFPRNVSSVF